MKTVWVVDDRQDVAQALAAMLSAEQIPAEAIPGAVNARARLQGDGGPRLMVLDLSMPSNGNRILKELLQNPAWTFPVIVLTGREEMLKPEVRNRAAVVLPKTVDPVELLIWVRQLLR